MKILLNKIQQTNLNQYAPGLARTRLHDGVFWVPKCFTQHDMSDCFGNVKLKEVK